MRQRARWFPARTLLVTVVLAGFLVGVAQEPPTVHFHRPPATHATTP